MARATAPLKVLSWNVNGLRAAANKGFGDWLEGAGDIVGVQEVRAFPDQLPEDLRTRAGWRTDFAPAQRPGYSGVGMFARLEPDKVERALGVERFDVEGRLQLARFGRLFIANVYFPNGSGPNRDHSRVPYKLDFYRAVFELVERKRRGGYRVLVMGDFNTAHREIDLARPRQNQKTSGFLPEEREELDRWLAAGWVDTFRHLEPGPGHYSWWSQRGTARERNVGWRIDYVLATPNVRPFLRDAFIQRDVSGSDHAPVGVELDRGVLG
ncbi:exodeoxyribonuclease III [Pseudenhygromyxa sp. WMMC2535]|uniref:exodeoxyribonuclease III n=1 Tax=Pseudenhygromyxa sp. WMMC2535 TaxID=2712867 RepID=UPI0015543B54|nr:exodeoxyribonuclease III [Pseudenhygromyxa sp. WMMC2535]NVB38812.1 exodeoxyribonuclease III [Pseudenhygromyxa sp. WMMC2535]